MQNLCLFREYAQDHFDDLVFQESYPKLGLIVVKTQTLIKETGLKLLFCAKIQTSSVFVLNSITMFAGLFDYKSGKHVN